MFELHIRPCPEDEIDSITEILENHGALSVTFVDYADDPILEPGPGETPLWQHAVIEALFEIEAHAQTAKKAVSDVYESFEYQLKDIPEQDWIRASINNIEPKRFGENLWVCPSWQTPPEPGAINIMLDPGLAFGTGTHPTTSLCLKWLDAASLTEQTVIDYGCGSGILAIAALKLGAKHAYAVDIDKQALIATLDNAEKNQVTEASLTCDSPDALHTPVDILIANILLTPLTTLEARFNSLLKPGGLLVLSGVLSTQIETLESIYSESWEHISTQYEDDWACITFKKY